MPKCMQESPQGLHPMHKKLGQLKKAENERNSLPWERAQQLIIHTSTTMQTEQVIGKNIYVYTYICEITTNEKRGHKFENGQGGGKWGEV